MAELMVLAAAPIAEHAQSTSAETHAAESEPTSFGLAPGGWVALAMAIFLAILLIKRVPALIAGKLDKSIADIRHQLDEAKALRAEAEKLRAEYDAKIKAAESDAAGLRAHAEEEARQIIADAKVSAKELTQRRAKMAEDKIGAAERAAIADIRAKAADTAAAAATKIIAETHGAKQDQVLVDTTIAGLGTLN